MPQSDFILKTKFFLPQIASDFVERKKLLSKFSKLETVPIMLVSASSGYGKSMAVSHFLKNQIRDHSWLSLSSKENDFQQFIKYFINTIEGTKAGFGKSIYELLDVPNPPSAIEIAELLQNELANLDALFFIILDDYHHIKNENIHLFISKLFEYPQPFFRLIIISRRDPELPISIWRSKEKIVDIRSIDLMFNKREIAEFYQKAINFKPGQQVLSSIEKSTEGWVSGLRMLILSTDMNNKDKSNVINFSYKNSHVILGLVDTMLKNQPLEIRYKVLRLSIVKQFNLELFTELCLGDEEKDVNEVIYHDFISNLMASNMFITTLDNSHNWYRFHHLFSDYLINLLTQNFNRDEIELLRVKSAVWYTKKGLQLEAIEQFIAANRPDQALHVFSKYRLELMAKTQFQLLESVYNIFPEEYTTKKGILLITMGWILLQKGNIPKMALHIEPLSKLLTEEGHPKELNDLLLGEFHTMKTFDTYLSNVDMKSCFEHSKQAIDLLNGRNPYALGVAWVYYGASLQHLGELKRAKKDVYKILEVAEEPMLRGHVLLILGFLDWFEGNLGNIIQTAEHLLELGDESGIKMLIVNGNIFKGIALYYQNKDEEAKEFLLKSHELRRHTYLHMSFGTGMALADIHAKNGQIDKANALIKEYETTALQQGGKLFIKITKSASSFVNWKYLNEKSGLKWAKENDYTDFLPLASLYSPEIVQANILIADKDDLSHEIAEKILEASIPFFEQRNDKNVLIRAYVIQALLFYKRKQSNKAYKILEKVLSLTTFGHYVRPYMSLGESMKSLLLSYKKTKGESKHLNEILDTFKENPEESLVLSMREKQVLALAENMTNKEVGNQLFISEKTVKTHITNINKKLKVTNKIDALIKAKEFKLL